MIKEKPLFIYYMIWHYSQGLRELVGVFGNILWFVKNFFSFSLLFSTLFAPWRRMGESYTKGFDLSAFASTFIVNTLMRIVGFVSRIVVLVVGLASYLLVCVLFGLVFMLWVLAPALLVGSAILSATFFVIR